jgi:hypothetical protein
MPGYALDAKAAIFRRAWRLLPALAAILIPASVLSKKSAMLSPTRGGWIEGIEAAVEGHEVGDHPQIRLKLSR